MSIWKDQIDSLKVPYPQKAELQREIEEHIQYFPQEENGHFASEELSDLYDVHNTYLLKLLDKLQPSVRRIFESAIAVAPMVALLLFLLTEGFMLEFIKEGGAGMYVILAVGLALLSREIILALRIFVIRDHSNQNLDIDSTAAIIGATALVFLGFCATGLGAYFAAHYVEQKGLSPAVFIIGLRESMTCMIVSSSLAALVLLMHFFTRHTLKLWKVPNQLIG